MKFIEFFASPEGQRLWVQSTGFPPADLSVENTWFGAFTKNGLSAATLKYMTDESIAHGTESPNHMLTGYAQIATFLTNNLESIFDSDANPAKVLPPLAKSFNALLTQIHQGKADN